MKIKFLHESEIETAAVILLNDYEKRFAVELKPPIPVDEIVECCLELDFRFNNLEKLLGQKDILGAIWINDRKIVIDESLDPSSHPQMTGRFNFTLAHEAGHWILHRHYHLAKALQGGLFGSPNEPSIICRNGDTAPEEWQANTFAAFLLMPRQMIFEAWEQIKGNMRPDYVSAQSNFSCQQFGNNDLSASGSIKKMSKVFNVSVQAMQIKLKALGLIKSKSEAVGLFDKWSCN